MSHGELFVAPIYEGFGMLLLLLFSSVLVSSCGLLVPAWPFSLPFDSHFGPQTGSQNGFRNGPFLKPAATHRNSQRNNRKRRFALLGCPERSWVGLSCDSLGACLGSLGLSWASLKLSGTLWEFSWGSLELLWPPLVPSCAPLGLPWGCLVALLGPLGPPLGPIGPLLGLAWALQERDPKMNLFWVPLGSIFVGVLVPIFGPFWVQFWIPFWVSFWVSFFGVPLGSALGHKLPKGRPKEDQMSHGGPFLLLFTRVLACRSFCFFQASWCPLGTSWCRLGPPFAPSWVRFWTPTWIFKGTAENEDLLSWTLLNPLKPLL